MTTMCEVRTVCVLYKSGHDQARGLAWSVADWLAARGLIVQVRENAPEAMPTVVPPGAMVTAPFSLTVVLGGDGTMLAAARQGAVDQVPLFGINLGRVGFMTEAGLDDWPERLGEILDHGFTVARRILLDVSVIRGNATVFTTTAVNDAVVSRGAMARLAAFDVSLGEADVCTLRADGVGGVHAHGLHGLLRVGRRTAHPPGPGRPVRGADLSVFERFHTGGGAVLGHGAPGPVRPGDVDVPDLRRSGAFSVGRLRRGGGASGRADVPAGPGRAGRLFRETAAQGVHQPAMTDLTPAMSPADGRIRRYGEDPLLDAWLLHFMTENHLEHSIDPENATPEQLRFMVALPPDRIYIPCTDEMFARLSGDAADPVVLAEYAVQLDRVNELLDAFVPDPTPGPRSAPCANSSTGRPWSIPPSSRPAWANGCAPFF